MSSNLFYDRDEEFPFPKEYQSRSASNNESQPNVEVSESRNMVIREIEKACARLVEHMKRDGFFEASAICERLLVQIVTALSVMKGAALPVSAEEISKPFSEAFYADLVASLNSFKQFALDTGIAKKEDIDIMTMGEFNNAEE